MKGHFPKDRFAIDLDGRTVTCPAGVTAPIRAAAARHAGDSQVRRGLPRLPAGARCTTARGGRTITIGPHEARLAAARIRQADPAWKATTRPPGPRSSARSAT